MKRMVAVVALLGALVASLSASAQTLIGQQEDFEDDTVGQNPTAPWYTYTESCPDAQDDVCQVIGSGIDGTTKSFKMDVESSPWNTRFDFDQVYAWETLTFYLRLDFFCGGISCTSTMDIFGLETITIDSNQNNNYWTYDGQGQAGCTSRSQWAFVVYNLNYNTNTFTRDIANGCLTDSGSFAGSGISGLRFRNLAGNNFIGYIDQIQGDGGPLEVVEEVPEPAEFDAGLLVAVEALGFITPGSQLLFVIIVEGVVFVGLAAALQWFTSGKGKNNILLSVPALFGIFFIVIGFMDIWMYILSLMLGLLAVNTGDVVANTYYDLVINRRLFSRAVRDEHEIEIETVGEMEGEA